MSGDLENFCNGCGSFYKTGTYCVCLDGCMQKTIDEIIQIQEKQKNRSLEEVLADSMDSIERMNRLFEELDNFGKD